MGIVEQSKNLPHVLQRTGVNPLLQARLDIAKYRLKVAIAVELHRIGMFAPTDRDIDDVYNGLPEDVLYRELAART